MPHRSNIDYPIVENGANTLHTFDKGAIAYGHAVSLFEEWTRWTTVNPYFDFIHEKTRQNCLRPCPRYACNFHDIVELQFFAIG